MNVQQIDLGYRPHRFQLQAHNAMRRFTVAVAHRRFGKTFMAVNTLINASLTTKKDNARFGYLAPFLKQAKGVSWDYLKRFAMQVPNAKPNESELTIEFPHNNSKIRLFGGDNADTMRGLYFDGVVVDELADLKPDVWGSIVRPALADRKGWALFIGTPKGLNQLSELYHYAAAGTDPEWQAMMFRVDETGIIDEAELASSRLTMSDAQYRQEWLCDWSAAADNVLIPIDMVMASCRKLVTEGECEGMPRILGVDVARFGDDRSVILKRWGRAILHPDVFQGIDNMELARRVVATIDDWKPDAVFIDAGRGEGVIDRVRQLGYSVVEVNFGGTSVDPHFANMRSYMWGMMEQWLQGGGHIPDNLALKTDLCVPTYSFDVNSRMVLESKDKIKARGMKSPDVGDAAALTFAQPVAPKSHRAYQLAKSKPQEAYDGWV